MAPSGYILFHYLWRLVHFWCNSKTYAPTCWFEVPIAPQYESVHSNLHTCCPPFLLSPGVASLHCQTPAPLPGAGLEASSVCSPASLTFKVNKHVPYVLLCVVVCRKLIVVVFNEWSACYAWYSISAAQVRSFLNGNKTRQLRATRYYMHTILIENALHILWYTSWSQI